MPRTHERIVREALKSHGGSEVRTMGDGFMASFSSASRALECAIAMQRAFAEHNERLLRQAQDARAEPRVEHAEPVEAPIRVRIGLHTGEAIKEAEDFYGKSAILAARIADEAQGGEILVSSLLRELTESAGDIAFGEGREVELKGLKGKQRVHAVTWEHA